MVIELIAGRILAPHIGVSLYTWTSIIGVILAGIALGNYIGGKIADRYPSPLLLASIFFAGGLSTIAILPATELVTSADLFDNLPVMWDFTLKTSFIFLLPAIILSMVSPLVIKLTLAHLGQTGGIVGTIYACSTAGAILGTFMTGFYFILWFGTRMLVWVVAAVLLLTGIIVWFSWRVPGRWHLSLKNFIIWMVIIEVVLTSVFLFQFRESWQENYTAESNYQTIRVVDIGNNIKELFLDHLCQSIIIPEDPTLLGYDYLYIFAEIVKYVTREDTKARVLHLGGGAYSFPRYMEAIYPGSVNEVVEIDSMVTRVAHEELGLPLETSITTYNQDARLFLIQRKTGAKYDIVIGDIFNDKSTPYHLTTLEFNNLVKANMEEDGIYLVNIIDDYERGRYLPSFVYTLRHTFNYVYLFLIIGESEESEKVGITTFVIAATDHQINLDDYWQCILEGGKKKAVGYPQEVRLEEYPFNRESILLIDDHAPTDILVAPIFRR